MKSMIGFFIVLASATTALANDYQIIPGTNPIGANPNVSFAFRALVVDVTSGPIYLGIGQMKVLTSTATIGCQKTTVHGGVTIPTGPAALSPLSQGASFDGVVAYPGIWKVSSGVVTFCSCNANGLEPDLYLRDNFLAAVSLQSRPIARLIVSVRPFIPPAPATRS